jgi:hypothetical protein
MTNSPADHDRYYRKYIVMINRLMIIVAGVALV